MESAYRRTRPGFRGAAILVVERHPAVRTALCDLLQHGIHSCRVYEALDEEGAVAVGATAPPDAAVVDLGSLIEDPQSALKRLREAFRNAPIVVLSAADASTDKNAALEAGAAAYVVKQRMDADLVGTLRDLLSARQLEA